MLNCLNKLQQLEICFWITENIFTWFLSFLLASWRSYKINLSNEHIVGYPCENTNIVFEMFNLKKELISEFVSCLMWFYNLFEKLSLCTIVNLFIFLPGMGIILWYWFELKWYCLARTKHRDGGKWLFALPEYYNKTGCFHTFTFFVLFNFKIWWI